MLYAVTKATSVSKLYNTGLNLQYIVAYDICCKKLTSQSRYAENQVRRQLSYHLPGNNYTVLITPIFLIRY